MEAKEVYQTKRILKQKKQVRNIHWSTPYGTGEKTDTQSAKQNREPRNRPTQLMSTNFQQKCKGNSKEKG